MVNYDGKYLTAETFGFKLNATGTALKRKQKWTLEFDAHDDNAIYLRSHLGRYLAGDRRGNATCDSEQRGDVERFRVHYASDGSGRWALSSAKTGYYFGGFDERIRCYEKKPRRTEWWTVHLDVHPQVTLRNANRQRYASAWDDYVGVTETVPWGGCALFTLEYVEGRCAVRTFDGRCLDRSGSLVDGMTPDSAYGIEIRRSGIAFRDCTGTYLSVVGRDGVIQARSKSPGKDELFVVEDSQPQVYFTAHNGRLVSTRQGIDVTANQFDEEPTEKEIFQIEFEGESSSEADEDQGMCRIRTWDNKYWITEEGGSSGIHATGNDPCDAGLFAIRCHSNGAISLTAKNGRYVTTRVNGSLYAGTEKLTAKEIFRFTLVNRPRLVLKCEHGFVGFHSSTCSRYECNKAAYDVIIVEYDVDNPGVYYFKGHNGKYWSVDNEGRVKADQPQEPAPFVIELRGRSRMAIRTMAGQYLVGEQNGCIAAKQNDPQKATLWEY